MFAFRTNSGQRKLYLLHPSRNLKNITRVGRKLSTHEKVYHGENITALPRQRNCGTAERDERAMQHACAAAAGRGLTYSARAPRLAAASATSPNWCESETLDNVTCAKEKGTHRTFTCRCLTDGIGIGKRVHLSDFGRKPHQDRLSRIFGLMVLKGPLHRQTRPARL